MSIFISGMSSATMPSAVSGANVHSSPPEEQCRTCTARLTTRDQEHAPSPAEQFPNQAFQRSNTPAVFKAEGASVAVWGAIDTSGAGRVSAAGLSMA